MIRKLAVRGIGRLGNPADSALLGAALADLSDDVRVEAAHAAEANASEDLREPLTKALNDPQHLVRERAASALATLDGTRRSPVHQSGAVAAPLQPSPHAIDEGDPPDLVLALDVAAHHGEISATVRGLLEVLDRKRLTQAAVDDLEDTLEDAGLRSEPPIHKLELDDQVRIIRTEVIPEFELRAHVDASGPWRLSVHDLLRMFDRSKLTDRALTEIAEALDYADLTTEPPISSVAPHDEITITRGSD